MVPTIPISTYSLLWIDPTTLNNTDLFAQVYKLWKWCVISNTKLYFKKYSFYLILSVGSFVQWKPVTMLWGKDRVVRNYGLQLTASPNLSATRTSRFRNTSEASGICSSTATILTTTSRGTLKPESPH